MTRKQQSKLVTILVKIERLHAEMPCDELAGARAKIVQAYNNRDKINAEVSA